MRKFIHSSFELDLSNYKITDTAENPWLTGTYFAKYSYPFNIDLDDELDQALGFLSHYNSVDSETIFEGIYVHGNIMEKAVLEIEEIDTILSVTLRYGFDEFPNFKKKLAELPLLQIEVFDIYVHANYTVPVTWPNIEYNFPQIHIDKIDPENDEVWADFEKIINNRRAGYFLRNEADLEQEISHNRNIIQPLPYLLYLLQVGFRDAGYNLRGDIMQDPDLMKTLVYTDTEYYTTLTQESISLYVPATEYDVYYPNTIIDYEVHYAYITMNKRVDIPHLGRYRITGSINMRKVTNKASEATIKFRGQVIYTISIMQPTYVFTVEIDRVFETFADLQENYLTFEYSAGFRENDIIFDININPIRLHDDSGEAVPTIINPNEINLKRAVPDMTFGDLVKLVLAMKFMNLSIVDGNVYINYIRREISSAVQMDCSKLEVKRPKRKFNKRNSFLIRYDEVDSKDYTYTAVFQNKDGIVTTGYTADDKTAEIALKALPLPMLNRNSVQTAHAFLQDNSKPLFVMYNGLINDKNVTQDPANLLVPALHEAYYKNWWAARIDTSAFTWSFHAPYEEILELTPKCVVHAYGNLHLVKSLQKTEVSPDLFEVEIETEVMK
jgi:hypothetical protein